MPTRFRSGLVQLVRFPVSSATVIEPGDLLFVSGGLVAPAADFTWTTDLATTQAAFAAAFVGVAYSGSADGETEPVSVDVSPLAVYESEANPAAFSVGDLLAPAETVSALASQMLDQVASAAQAIARAMETTATNSPTVRACFASSIHTASANVNAAVG